MCEFCGNDKDIIFPFQLNKCQRCEGEPSLLVAGLGGPTAPAPRSLIPLSWRDWKPRRLARALSRDRREGEGGEEDLDKTVDQSVKQEETGEMSEEPKDTGEERQEKGGIFQALTRGKLVKVFSKSKDDEAEQEGGTESEREQREDDSGEVCSDESAKKKNVNMKRERANLLKVLQIDRLKKSISKDRSDTDSETCSSRESLDEVGQEKKGRWRVSGFLNLPKGFSKREVESEGKTEEGVEESEIQSLEKPKGNKEKGNAMWEVEESRDSQEKGKTDAAEVAKSKSGAEKGDKSSAIKQLKPHQLPGIFSRGKSRGEEDKSRDGEVEAEEEGQTESVTVTRTNWRSRKTRKARRVTRGKKMREGTDKESNTEGGGSAEMNDTGECTDKGRGAE